MDASTIDQVLRRTGTIACFNDFTGREETKSGRGAFYDHVLMNPPGAQKVAGIIAKTCLLLTLICYDFRSESRRFTYHLNIIV